MYMNVCMYMYKYMYIYIYLYIYIHSVYCILYYRQVEGEKKEKN